MNIRQEICNKVVLKGKRKFVRQQRHVQEKEICVDLETESRREFMPQPESQKLVLTFKPSPWKHSSGSHQAPQTSIR